ncbi:MAG: alpha-amylase [Micromonosporaceae bacterium]
MRTRTTRIRTTTAAAVLVAAALVCPVFRATVHATAATGTDDVIANLWMWPWPSVATECANVLRPAGYGAVQVAPPEDSISVSGHPWWDIYQPAAYDLNSRMGTRAQFAAMVSACHTAGVKVYVDAVINHMTGANQTSTTSYGGASFTNNYSYPSAGYTSADFHFYPANCPESDNQIHNWDSQADVQECQLLGLSDLNTETEHVRSRIAGYLNDLTGLGVDGFRVDAAKHINPTDMAAVKARLTAQPSYFAQEVFPGSSNSNLQPPAFEGNGGVLEFSYAYDLKSQFTGSIANLQTFGTSWGLQPSSVATAFVENHDTERNGSTLSYKDGATDTLANVFMLAWNYGTPNVMSSFDFANTDQSPPADANGFVTAPACGGGWECQHRTRAIRNMVGFHNATHGDTTVSNWWSDGANEIAFSRGPAGAASGWISINNGSGALPNHAFATGLPAGTYCDVIHGDFTASTGACSGPTVVVNSSGTATVPVAAKDAVAIDVNARVTGSATPAPYSATFDATVTTWWEQNVYLVGSIGALGNWNPASAVALSSANYPVWSVTVSLPANTYFEYKYIKKDPDGTIEWESGANRSATTGASGSATFNDTWK